MDIDPKLLEEIRAAMAVASEVTEDAAKTLKYASAVIRYHRANEKDFGDAVAALHQVCMDFHPGIADKIARAMEPHLNKITEREKPIDGQG